METNMIPVIKEEPMDVDEDNWETEYQDNEDANSNDILKSHKTFIGIEYPGVVKNIDKMLQTLGGIQTISGVFCSDTPRRLELNFRPSDVYSKPTCGDKEHTLGILLKVRIKRRRKKVPKAEKSPPTENSVVAVDILGLCNQVFRFDFFSDFQYLPVHNESGVLKNIYDNIIPNGFPDGSWLEKNDIPYFFTPPSFSRIDTTEGYKYSTSKKDSNVERNIIGRTRQPRSGYTKLCTFQDTEIPEKPFKGAYNVLRIKMVGEHNLNILKKLFEERPIWPRNGILARTGFTNDHCKHILPAVAYYFVNGPWRTMWVRYGYNPRKEPTSRIYQTLDFRVKIGPGAATKRTNIAVKASHCIRKKTVLLDKIVSLKRPVIKKRRAFKNYIFKPGNLPETRQMFYAFCDLHVPEIQAMVARLPELGPDAVCNERTGWLPAGFDERCREILHELVRKELKKRAETELVIDDDEDGDDDDGEWEADSDAASDSD